MTRRILLVLTLMLAQTDLPALPASISIPNAGKDALISPLRIDSPTSITECRVPCSLLSTSARVDSLVFFLHYQVDQGLLRLSGHGCRQRTQVTIARRGEVLRFAIARVTAERRNSSETYEWLFEPELNTYYAVAVTDAQVARRIANHMDNLPLRCLSSTQPGLQGNTLREWLSDFAIIAARSSQFLDWRAIRVHE